NAHFIFSHAPPYSEIYTLSLHDALPIFERIPCIFPSFFMNFYQFSITINNNIISIQFGYDPYLTIKEPFMNIIFQKHYLSSQFRSEEHTSELQSRENLVCRLLLEKKKDK